MTAKNQRTNRRSSSTKAPGKASGNPRSASGRVTPKGTKPTVSTPKPTSSTAPTVPPRRLDGRGARGGGRPLPIHPSGSRVGHRGNR